MAPLAVQIAPQVFAVPTMSNWINSYIFSEDDGSLTLVDCGLKNAPKKIVAAIKSLNRDMSDVKRVVFTHSHDDHAGGAAKVIEIIGTPQVIAHVEEKQFLESGINPPQDYSHFAGKFFRFMPSGGFSPIRVHKTVSDGEILPIAGGLQVIHTPGHTPGHVSLLHQPSGTLITGDSIFNYGFRVAWSLSAFCTNFNQSKETALRFLDLDFTTAAFTHGPHIKDKGKKKLKKFLSA
jgi:glyoxylase-like metal-dependent hydrolase (beta-lactamase superfamily II)